MMLITDSFGGCDWAYFRTEAGRLLMVIPLRETSSRFSILFALEKGEGKDWKTRSFYQ
jgi:hypothetical protein